MVTTIEQGTTDEVLGPTQVQSIRAAYDLIGRKGVHRVSLQEIADRAGTSKGNVLYHFKTKDGLILKTFEWVLSRTGDRIHEAIRGETSSRRQVSLMIDAIFVNPEANRRFYLAYLDLLGHATRMTEFEAVAAAFRSIVDSAYAQVIERGVSESVYRVDDVDEAARIVRAIIDGLFLQWLQETDWVRLHPKYQRRCERAVLAYLGVDDEFIDTVSSESVGPS
ncbi:MAG: TetR/AcrR family transcriptional regulator [Acidimicrobiia bacterium]|nr:TetR/AcrR family transcriptional regulator [Acidimicrobiia bacterium]